MLIRLAQSIRMCHRLNGYIIDKEEQLSMCVILCEVLQFLFTQITIVDNPARNAIMTYNKQSESLFWNVQLTMKSQSSYKCLLTGLMCPQHLRWGAYTGSRTGEIMNSFLIYNKSASLPLMAHVDSTNIYTMCIWCAFSASTECIHLWCGFVSLKSFTNLLTPPASLVIKNST